MTVVCLRTDHDQLPIPHCLKASAKIPVFNIRSCGYPSGLSIPKAVVEESLSSSMILSNRAISHRGLLPAPCAIVRRQPQPLSFRVSVSFQGMVVLLVLADVSVRVELSLDSCAWNIYLCCSWQTAKSSTKAKLLAISHAKTPDTENDERHKDDLLIISFAFSALVLHCAPPLLFSQFGH